MEEPETPEELLVRQHRKEKKDMQAQIQSMKNAVPKNDKKRRKQLTEEIAKLEADLNQKHEEEIRQLKSTADTESSEVEEVANGVETLRVEDGDQQDLKQPRVTKAQKRRDKKAAQVKERESRIAEAEVQNLQGVRHQEGLKLAEKLAGQQLQIREIPSDGHCMYRAVEDQLAQRAKMSPSGRVKRGRASCFRHHGNSPGPEPVPQSLQGGQMDTPSFSVKEQVVRALYGRSTSLGLNGKKLEDVPACVSRLPNLRVLSLSHNRLSFLPSELVALQQVSPLRLFCWKRAK
ncbi:unnamed protein product [Menidia menidia]|uniref:(Atlantic silverside) hypothetical protein n=1 Tax=Menidia menidia TaxID=238744 RepID=A0A8S4AMF1_9TELE|nr:unnamed protein product [Menidia menidia]